MKQGPRSPRCRNWNEWYHSLTVYGCDSWSSALVVGLTLLPHPKESRWKSACQRSYNPWQFCDLCVKRTTYSSLHSSEKFKSCWGSNPKFMVSELWRSLFWAGWFWLCGRQLHLQTKLGRRGMSGEMFKTVCGGQVIRWGMLKPTVLTTWIQFNFKSLL